jgi:hypothetical protein
MKHLIPALLFIGSLTSCNPVKLITSKSTDINGQGVIQKPVIVDLEVKENKVNGSTTSPTSTGIEQIKSMAVADAVKKSNADILVEPIYEIITVNGQTTVNVTGFPGTYRNFRPIKEEDIPLLKTGSTQLVNTTQSPAPGPPKKNPAGGIVLVTLLLLGLIGGLAAALGN